MTSTPVLSLITSDWLQELGFRKQWTRDTSGPNFVLWLGDSRQAFVGTDDLGLELSTYDERGVPSDDPRWFCWLRSDVSQSRGRFCFVRYLRKRHELVNLIEAITGEVFDPARIELGCWRYQGQPMDRSGEEAG